MIIRRIRIRNFRGFRDKTVEFEDKDVILFDAPNGTGKTTVIDAIEWCLTGNIGRLKRSFDIRSTNDTERALNTTGILKNRDADKNDYVRVELCLFNNNTETVLCREQKSDVLDPDKSKVSINGNEQDAVSFIKKHIEDSFYHHHFCDVQKSFSIQSTKRSELTDLFSEFITNYDEQITIANNLDIFVKDVERYIEDKKNDKTKTEAIIKEKESRLSDTLQNVNNIPYPTIEFYSEEKKELAELSKQELDEQKTKIVNCGYLVAKENLTSLIKNETLLKQKDIIDKIIIFRESKSDSISRAEKAGVLKDTSSIMSLTIKLQNMSKISFNKTNIFNEELLTESIRSNLDKNAFETNKTEVLRNEEKVKELTRDIELLSNNNKILELLSNLTANKKEIINYRITALNEKGYVRCPLCGSETFANVEEEYILTEAEEYIRQNGSAVGEKIKERLIIQAKIDGIYAYLISSANLALETACKSLKEEIRKLTNLYDEVRPYYILVDELHKINNTINVDELTDERIKASLADIEKLLLEETKIEAMRSSYQRILTALGYNFDNESLEQTLEKISNLVTKPFVITNFSNDVFVAKLNAIDSILNNQKITSICSEIDKNKEKVRKIDSEIARYNKLLSIANKRATDIRKTVSDLSLDEYTKVGPALTKYYNKLSRYNFVEDIQVKQEEDKILLVDSKDKNIVNVLSNGQICVFMLAYFFAGISVRNKKENFKVFFIDDLTACMDDVNMLAFMDLLKYQMTPKDNIEQLFFVTCDNRISDLLMYKLDGHKIKYCEINEQKLKE